MTNKNNNIHSWERARNEEQKQQRINEILTAVAKLESKLKYDEITVVAIAKEASFTRSNLYKYFETKEEIFLELVKYDFINWSNDFLEEISEKTNISSLQFAETWTNILFRHERFIRLLPLINYTLEENVSLEKLISFKKTYFSIISKIIPTISNKIHGITLEKAADFFTIQGIFTIGLHISSCHTDKQIKAIKSIGEKYIPIDQKKTLTRFICFIINGLLEEV